MNLGTAIGSSIGRKILNAITGLFFVGFVIGHLTGNLLLFVGPEAFNNYAYFLGELGHGAAIYLVEVVMIVFLLTHAASGISVWMNKSRARSRGYEVNGDAGGRSNKTTASRSMLYTGLLLLAFIIFHVAQFKFGLLDPRTVSQQWVNVDGIHMVNLYGRVVQGFAQPIWTFVYIVIMLMLGSHLWHGAWSAFQSLGLANDRYLPTLRNLAHGLAVVLAVGFILLPGLIFLNNARFQQINTDYAVKYSDDVAAGSASQPAP